MLTFTFPKNLGAPIVEAGTLYVNNDEHRVVGSRIVPAGIEVDVELAIFVDLRNKVLRRVNEMRLASLEVAD